MATLGGLRMSPVFGHGRLRLYLLKLLEESPRHGYEVIRLLQDRFLGVYSPSPGTIYPRLARLEEEGLVTHEVVDGKKVFSLTDKGRAELHGRLDELADLEKEISDSVRDIARELKEDVRRTVRSLREELTQMARDMRRAGPDDPPRFRREQKEGWERLTEQQKQEWQRLSEQQKQHWREEAARWSGEWQRIWHETWSRFAEQRSGVGGDVVADAASAESQHMGSGAPAANTPDDHHDHHQDGQQNDQPDGRPDDHQDAAASPAGPDRPDPRLVGMVAEMLADFVTEVQGEAVRGDVRGRLTDTTVAQCRAVLGDATARIRETLR
jgi:DNA-binding PadR family transcriptional regulator